MHIGMPLVALLVRAVLATGTAQDAPLHPLSAAAKAHGAGLVSMVPGRPFKWCHRSACIRVSEQISATSRKWLFDHTAAAWRVPFSPLGQGERWRGWMWSELPPLQYRNSMSVPRLVVRPD